MNSQEYIDWMESHEPKCTANFDKPSKAVEALGAVDVWGGPLRSTVRVMWTL